MVLPNKIKIGDFSKQKFMILWQYMALTKGVSSLDDWENDGTRGRTIR
jgi:hypothetical protein